MRRQLITLLAALAAAAATTAVAVADREGDGGRGEEGHAYAIGLWGDLPYASTQRTTGVPNLVADMNRQRLAFSVHDGDIKSGSERCDNPIYTQMKAFFNSLEAPAIYTPGDNEWTDCDRPAAGAYNSRERLDFVRATFFSTPFSLGQHRLRLDVQAAPYVENRRWRIGGVTYVTLNVPSSCNNRCDVAPDEAEYQARNAADIEWLHQAFDRARHDHSAAVMVIFQANPGWDQTDIKEGVPQREPRTLVETDGNPDGFKDLLTALRDETIAFRRPVASVNGDTHYFRVDKPFLDSQGRRLENFTRVETFGDNQSNGNNDVHWLKVRVDAGSREVFSYQPQIVPANRTAVPAP
jgi:hypothetical protein